MAGGGGSFVTVVVVVTGAGVAESFGGAFLDDSVDYHPSPLLHALLHFCKWGNVVPMNIFLWLVWALSCCITGIAAILGCSVLMVGAGVGTAVGRIRQSFLFLRYIV